MEMQENEFSEIEAKIDAAYRESTRCRNPSTRIRRTREAFAQMQTDMNEAIARVGEKDIEAIQEFQRLYLGGMERLLHYSEQHGPLFLIAQKIAKDMTALRGGEQSTGLTRKLLEIYAKVPIPTNEVVPVLGIMGDMACLTDHRSLAVSALDHVFKTNPQNPEVLDAFLPLLKQLSRRTMTAEVQQKLIGIRELMVDTYPDRVDFQNDLDKLKKREFTGSPFDLRTPGVRKLRSMMGMR